MSSSFYRYCELIVLFVVLPIVLVTALPMYIKMSFVGASFLYLLWILLKVEKINIHIVKGIEWQRFWRLTLMKFIGIAALTLLYITAVDIDSLFNVVRSKPLMWVLFLGIYSLFSVYPQELIYRTFFFKRYRGLFKYELLFLFINAALFSLAHLFFQNTLVIVITFVGGLLFAWTFQKTKSTILVSIEHALYGGWLYTVGYGAMLGFPV